MKILKITKHGVWSAPYPFGRQASQPERTGLARGGRCEEPGCREPAVAVCDQTTQAVTLGWCNRGLCHNHAIAGQLAGGQHLCSTHKTTQAQIAARTEQERAERRARKPQDPPKQGSLI